MSPSSNSLRFIGDVPLWAGLLLALIVGGLAWRYYRRESLDLNQRLRWALPLLRSLAFLLGILVLCGPVLHHRSVVGELGSVQIYVDGSRSMNLLDRHLSSGRKLLIAEQQGWLNPGTVDSTLLEQAATLARVRGSAETTLQRVDLTDGDLTKVKTDLLAAVQEAAAGDLIATINATPQPKDQAIAHLQDACESIASVEQQLQTSFDDNTQRLLDSGDPAVQNALTVFDETPRWRRAERSLLETSQALFVELKQHHNVEVLVLNDEEAIEILGDQTGEAAPSEFHATPDGTVSDLASGIAQSQKTSARSENVADEGRDPPAVTKVNSAIVLLSDGQHNSGPSPLQTARVLGSQGVAIYPVALGADTSAHDVAVTGLEHPEMVFQKDRVRGTLIARDQMPAGQPLVASVTHDGEVLWQQQLLTNNTGERRIDFEFTIDELVERLSQQFTSNVKQHAVPLNLVASIAPLHDEAETENNQRPLRFAAITQNYRLLIMDGRSRWETRYLRNVFDRDTQWDVNVIIAGPGTDDETLPRGAANGMFPETREALFEYDLIIFGEVDPALLTDHEYIWLKEFVETRGGGMVLVDGNRGRMRAFSDDTLRPLLPVEYVAADIKSKPSNLQLTDKGRNVPALSFEVDRVANQQFWELLPPPHRINTVTALPGAEVLVEAVVNDISQPMMVTRNYGAGRVLYLASDETWRWRYKAADTYHQRIWNQLAKYVMPRPFASSDEYLSVDTGSVSYDNGDSASIRIRLMGLDGKPATDATVDALVWKDGRTASTLSLTADPDVPGIYRGTTGALVEGDYEVSVRASGFSQEALQARGRFVVLPPESGELENTSANEELLQQMATASGGVFLREEQIGQLASLLNPLSSGRVEESDSSLFESSIFSYSWFAVIVLLLGTEWFLRKRAGLL